MLFVRKKQHGLTTFLRYINDDSARAAAKRKRIFDFVVYGGVGSRNWVNLARGTYYVFDANTPTVKRNRVKIVTVTGKRIDPTRPTATPIVQNASGAIPAAVVLRHPYLRLINRSRTTFFTLFVVPLSTSTSDADIADVVARPTFDKVFGLQRPYAEIGVVHAEVGPGHTAVTSMRGFAAGRYLTYTRYGENRTRLRHGDVGLLTIR